LVCRHQFKYSAFTRLQESKADYRRVEELQAESEQLLTLQLINARSRVETAYKKFRIAEKAVEAAAENLRVLDNSFDVGLAANIDVLDGQVVLTDAETKLITARYDYWIAIAELERAIGTSEK